MLGTMKAVSEVSIVSWNHMEAHWTLECFCTHFLWTWLSNEQLATKCICPWIYALRKCHKNLLFYHAPRTPEYLVLNLSYIGRTWASCTSSASTSGPPCLQVPASTEIIQVTYVINRSYQSKSHHLCHKEMWNINYRQQVESHFLNTLWLLHSTHKHRPTWLSFYALLFHNSRHLLSRHFPETVCG